LSSGGVCDCRKGRQNIGRGTEAVNGWSEVFVKALSAWKGGPNLLDSWSWSASMAKKGEGVWRVGASIWFAK